MKYFAVLASLVALVSGTGQAVNYFKAFSANQCQVSVPKSAMTINPFDPSFQSQYNYCFDSIFAHSCDASTKKADFINMCAGVPNGDAASMKKIITLSRRTDASTCKETIKCMLMVSDVPKGSDVSGCNSYLTAVGYNLSVLPPKALKDKADLLMKVLDYKVSMRKSAAAKSASTGSVKSSSKPKTVKKPAEKKSAGVKNQSAKRMYRTNKRIPIKMN